MDLLFDLDGTLIDSSEGIVRCLQQALTAMGRPAPPAAGLRRRIGSPLPTILAPLLGTTAPAVVQTAVRHYRERYAAVGLYEASVYDGVPAVLDTLASSGHRLWVVTSKARVYARRVTEHFGLAGRFRDVCGPDLVDFGPKGGLIRDLLRREGLAAAATVMVGDRAEDILAAHENGLRAIGALWGYGTADELRSAQPAGLAERVQDLPAIVAAMVNGHGPAPVP